MSKSRSNKKRKEEQEALDEDDERILFFIPSAGINIEVLVFYIKKYLGSDSDAEPGVHPRDRDVDGYFIKSRLSLNAVMVADLRDDSKDWKNEKKHGRYGYSESDTAARRLANGSTAQPTIPEKTRQLAAARRGDSAQPTGPVTSQKSTTVPPVARHAQQSTNIPPTGYTPGFYPADTGQRHEATFSGQLPPSNFYGSPTTGQPRTPAINVNLNMASYQQSVTSRHQSPPQSNVLPSIEGRSGYYGTPAPQYEEEDSRDNKSNPPRQPTTTGTQGFSSTYTTAGPTDSAASRHDRPLDRPLDRPPERRR